MGTAVHVLQSHSLGPALLGPGQHSLGPCALSQGTTGLAQRVLIGEPRTEWALEVTIDFPDDVCFLANDVLCTSVTFRSKTRFWSSTAR